MEKEYVGTHYSEDVVLQKRLEICRQLVRGWTDACLIGLRVNGEPHPSQANIVAWRLFVPNHFDLWDVPAAVVTQSDFFIPTGELTACTEQELRAKIRQYFVMAMISLWALLTKDNEEHNMRLIEAELEKEAKGGT